MFEFKYLSWSNLRYKVNSISEVYVNDILIEPVEKNGKLFVELDWIDGYRGYPLELVVVCAFCNVDFSRYFDIEIFDRIDVIFKDGCDNYFPSNLTYVFNGPPIVDTNRKDFYLIPNFPSYSVNRKGVLYSYATSIFKTWSTLVFPEKTNKKAGYQYCTLYEDGVSKMLYQHRVLCLVFKKFEGAFNQLTVNHINGIKSDNDLDNLEWLTYSENTKHAYSTGLNKRNTRILVKNLLTEEIKTFDKVQDCANWLGEDNRFYIYARLSDRSNKVYSDFLSFKLEDSSEWPDYDIVFPKEVHDVHRVAVLNVFTNEIKIFDRASEASEVLKIKLGLILDHCRTEKVLPAYGYNFRFLNRADVWPKHTKFHLEVYKLKDKEHGDGVFVFDHVEDKEKFFPSVSICANALETTKGTIAGLCFTGRKLKKRYSFKMFHLKQSLILESISSEANKLTL